jgi:PAS domain-containing protein
MEYGHDADERMKIIFDTAPIGCLMFDSNFNIFDCNQETVKMFELPDKQVFIEKYFALSPEYQPCGKKSNEMMQENNIKTFWDGFNRFEWMHQTLSGEPLPCEIIHIRVKYKDEYVITAYIRDLRDYNKLLDKIRNENARYIPA